MADTSFGIVYAYVRQQLEMGMPDEVLLSAGAAASETAAAAPVLVTPAAAGAAGAGDGIALPANRSYEEKRTSLIALYRATEHCRTCPLGGLRTKFVFGSGNAAARLMIIGEAPGEEEDREGKPFVGAAGQLLTKMLTYINLDRTTDVFITNIVKCRPPGNRQPENSEAAACLPILKRQIEIIAPKILLLLGRVAAKELLGRTESIAKLRGEKLFYTTIPAVVTYHPAALLRNESYKAPAAEDFRTLQKMLNAL